jgi:hypothetical protein
MNRSASVQSDQRTLVGPLGVTLVLAAMLFAALLWASGGPTPVHADPGTIYVAPGAVCGTGYTPCYGDIQAAVDAAVPGDEIRVAAGTYTGVSARGGVTQVIYISKTVTIQGGYTTTDWTTPDAVANPTTLDAQRLGRVLTIIGDIAVSIQDLRITGGDAASLDGGGVYVGGAAVTIAGSEVFSNVASSGGGLFISYPEGVLLMNNVISDNLADGTEAGGGGGLCAWGQVTLIGNTIVNNRSAANGGGFFGLFGQFKLIDNTISNNRAGYGGLVVPDGAFRAPLSPQTAGGGVFTFDEATLIGNTISNNTAPERGGGVVVFYADALLEDNHITGNGTDGGGGGVYVIHDGDVTLKDNTIVGNTALGGGGGVASLRFEGGTTVLINNVVAGHPAATGTGVDVWGGSMEMIHTTLADYGTGLDVYDGAVALTDTIIVSHEVGIGLAANSTVTLESTLWNGNTTDWAGDGVIYHNNDHTGDPAFVDSSAGDYHIVSASAAVDAGVDAGVMEDLDGQPRPFGEAPDLGADEWSTAEAVVDPGPGGGGTLVTTVGTFTSTVTIPSGAVTTTTTLEFTALATTTQGSPPGVDFAGLAFDLDAYQGGALVPGFTFSVPVTITLDYGQGDVVGLDESSLVLETWDGGAWQDAACGPYERNPDENWLSVPVCHLSRFALFGERGTTFSLGEPGLSFRYVETFGVTEEAYIADTQHLNRPNGLFIDDTDSLYVVEEWGSRMLKYRTSDGANLLSIGVAGLQNRAEYSFDHPQDVALDSSGYIWVVDRHRAAQYDAGGGFLQELPPDDPWNSGTDNTHFDTPRGIAFDSAGRMYIADAENHRIQIYTFSGNTPVYSTTIGVTGVSGDDNGHFDRPCQVVIDGSDRLYVTDVNNARVQRCTYAGGWTCTTFHGTGSEGSGPDELDFVFGLGIDGSGNIYIADGGNNRVKRCDSSGSCTTLVTGFGWAADVAVDSSGKVYVSDWEDFVIRKYSSSGVLEDILAGTNGVPYLTDGGHFNTPFGVAVDVSGATYVSTDRGCRLLKLDGSGTPQWAAGTAGVPGSDDAHFGNIWAGASNVAVASDGTVYVADTGNHRVQVFDAGGGYIATLGGWGPGNYQFWDPHGVAVDHNDFLYVADSHNHRVQVYDSARQYLATLGVTGVSGSDNGYFDDPNGVAVDADGYIYVVDRDNSRLQVFDSSRTYVRTLGVPGESGDDFDHFDEPRDVAVDQQGQVYVADWWNNRVQVFDGSGAYVTTIGGWWGSRTGELRGPAGVDVDGAGNVYVADYGNHRIQKFSPGVPGWEQVNINGFGDRETNGVTALEVFGGQLYAGASNWEDGARVWRTADGTSWTSVSDLGLGTLYTNTNPAILDMIVFDGQLYASTGWDGVGGQLWRSASGAAWEQVEGNGFGDATNGAIAALGVFNNTLYATTHSFTSAHGLEIWRSSTGDSGDWSRVVADGNGDADNYVCTGLVEFRNHLYAAIENEADGAEVWRTDDGIDWTRVVTGGFGYADNTQTGGFAIFGDHLYVGTRNETTGAQLHRSSDGTTWEQMADDGFDDPNNVKIESLMTFNGYLYAGTDNDVTGLEVWRSSDGVAWTQVNPDGFGDSNNFGMLWSVATAAFNSRLYIGTRNGANGGELWKRTVTADFAASPTAGSPPLAVVFTNTSAGDYTQAWWKYGDGTGYTGTLLLPAHVYSETGSYTVSLTVSDGVDTSTLVRPDYIWVGYSVYLPMVVRGYQ